MKHNPVFCSCLTPLTFEFTIGDQKWVVGLPGWVPGHLAVAWRGVSALLL